MLDPVAAILRGLTVLMGVGPDVRDTVVRCLSVQIVLLSLVSRSQEDEKVMRVPTVAHLGAGPYAAVHVMRIDCLAKSDPQGAAQM